MLGDSAVLGEVASSGDAAAAAVAATSAPAATTTTISVHEGAESVVAAGSAAGVGSNSGDEDRARGEEGDRSFGGHRWPRQETLALLKIRSDMDVAFRDASVKGPLWEEVSRKLAKLGYHRSAKKCKEKFENVYKYHKRTKEGRSGKSDGKTYRFFDQLEALENHPSIQSTTTSSKAETALPASPVSVVAATVPTTVLLPMAPVANTTPAHVTVPSTTNTLPAAMAMPMAQGIITQPLMNPAIPSFPPPSFQPSTANPTIPSPFPSIPADLLSNSSSSSTSSDETLEGRRKRKRKWKDFFERLMKEVIEKQEELQKRFLEAIEKREHERMVREEAWRMQELARINREREILAQERSMAAAKDAAVMAFLQKIAEQQNLGQALNTINIPQLQPQAVAPPAASPLPVQQVAVQQYSQPHPQAGPPMGLTAAAQALQQQQVTTMEITKTDNGDNFVGASSSRWPKVEVEALIKLRTEMDSKYQENGPKGPLWEDISAAMRKLGYNRNAKRCKEKWENINKYFKKVKESNKKRPEDSKTCPYFHQLDALYRKKNKLDNNNPASSAVMQPPEDVTMNMNMMTPLMVRPEQQWPPQQNTRPGTGPDITMEEAQNDPMNRHNEDEDEDDEDKDGDEDDEEDEGGGNYEIVASKPASVGAGASAE
ncbi:hypothetical protein L6164_008841 [Bauhinia variegata]|uniref:Uncharacterized protein n=1 Tax=Bauhinia variegata TaxID=167791 RepID=A0ACB9PNJ0_BAUVA|nr:hypothetical protein L6164_008841 [Bauhinia variegata]